MAGVNKKKTKKNIYQHEIDLMPLQIKNQDRESFRRVLEKIKYRGYEVEQIKDGRKIVIDMYSEAHFKVISTLYNNAGLTRADIWSRIHGQSVREDSAEADLFKLIVADLSVGHIIRQYREVDYYGNFTKPSRRGRGSGSSGYVSAFDDDKQYELTKLGQQFVHYTMNEVVPKIEYKAA